MRKIVITSTPALSGQTDTYIIDAYTTPEFTTALDLIAQTLKTHACNEYVIKVTADDLTPGVAPLTREPVVTREELEELDAISHALLKRQAAHMSYPVVCVAKCGLGDWHATGVARSSSELMRYINVTFGEGLAQAGCLIEGNGTFWRYTGESKMGPTFIKNES